MEIAREQLIETDEQIEAAFDKLGYCFVAEDGPYFPADEMNRIREARKNWSDRGRIETDTPDVLVIERCQATSGQRRRDLVAVRFGEFCAIYGADE